MREPVKNYLSITKKEWNGLVILMALIVIALAFPYIYPFFHQEKTYNFDELEKAAAAFARQNGKNATSLPGEDGNKNTPVKLFKFDPNGLPEEKWKELGLSDHQIAIIKHYEAKGGHFYKPEDLKKIYSITPEDYTRVRSYINIEGSNDESFKKKPFVIVEVNTADSVQLTQVRGIGPAFAMRIIRYRNKIGGFYRKEQLKEVFGVDEEKYVQIAPEIKVNAHKLTKLNINTATFEDLRRFPYLSYKQMSAVVQYRKEHGDYESLADMKNVAILDDGILRKLEPYLVFK